LTGLVVKRNLLSYWFPVVAYCGLIFFLSSFSHPLPPAAELLSDKVLHVLEYSLLGFLSARALFSSDMGSSPALVCIIAFVFSALYGLSDEFHQSFVPGRNAALGDFAADAVGAFLGAIVYWAFMARRGVRP